jgi:predicted DNA-binding WGR domain protein
MRMFLQDKGRTSKAQVWVVERKGNRVITEWGQLDGAQQKTEESFEAVNVGKSNEKSPEEVAQESMDRDIKKKTREGYREVNPKTREFLTEKSSSEIDFGELPQNLRFFKPQNSINSYIHKKIEERSAWLLRKRDGMMHVVSIGEDGVPRMFSSNMLPAHKNEPEVPWLTRYPHLEADLKGLHLPARTILLGEICTCAHSGHRDSEGYAKDDFIYVGSVVKSLTPRALELQKEKGNLAFCIWDVAFWGGCCWLTEEPAFKRMNHVTDLLEEGRTRYITFPEVINLWGDGFTVRSQETKVPGDYIYGEARDTDEKIKTMLNWAKKLGWEGFVAIDPDIRYDDRAYNFHGKAERPKEVVKLKPTLEADFIVRWDPDNGIGERGKGKKSGGVGSVMAYLWDPDVKEEVPVCKVGGGLTDELVREFANPELYPMVWQIEFSEWTDKGALRFPEFVRVRDDKSPEDCTIYQKPNAEEE